MFEVFHQDDDLVIGIEWDGEIPFIHHHVYNWKLSTHKQMKKVFSTMVKELQEKNHTKLYSYFDKQNTNVDKFCDYYGFTLLSETPTEYIVVKEL